MGADYRARVVLGVRQDTSKLSRKVPTFPHSHPREWKVDPLSGEKLWRMESGVNVMRNLDYGRGPEIEVAEIGCDSGEVVVGLELCGCSGEGGVSDLSGIAAMSPQEIAAATDSLKTRLNSAGLLFHDSDFGVHVVMSISV